MAAKAQPAPRSQGVRAKRLSLFATPLAVSLLPETEDLKPALSALILACYQEDAQSEDAQLTTGLAWRGSFSRASNGPPQLAPLSEAAIVLAETIQAESGGAWDVSWRAEVLNPGQGFDVQCLKGGLWCASYLVDDGGAAASGGELELQDPRGAAPVMYAPGLTFAAPGGETLGISQTVRPKEGALIVFPAWLLQSTALHQGSDARLSLSLLFRPQSPQR
jgi:hypothetical protein